MRDLVALLRGINVGGNTILKMSDLKACLERAGLLDVRTYINSGNVAFRSELSANDTVTIIESAIRGDLAKDIPVMVRSREEICEIVANNPFQNRFSSHKEMHVIFLREPLTDSQFDHLKSAASNREEFATRGCDLYCYLPTGVADSILGKNYFEKKLKVSATARNWRTVERLTTL